MIRDPRPNLEPREPEPLEGEVCGHSALEPDCPECRETHEALMAETWREPWRYGLAKWPTETEKLSF